MKKLAILGTLHQSLGHASNAEFKNALTLVIEEHNTDVILEEWSDTQPKAFSKHLADELGLPWGDIGTPDLPEFKTYDGVIQALGFDPFKIQGLRVPRYGPLPAQSAREEAMVQNVRDFKPDSWQSGLLIVGAAHLQSMMQRLKDSYDVEGYCWIPGI